jgi:hypothetical protein
MASVAERRSCAPADLAQGSLVISQCANRTLYALSLEVFAGIKPHLQPVKLSFAEGVVEADQSIAEVYFPFSGVAVDWIRRHALGR